MGKFQPGTREEMVRMQGAARAASAANRLARKGVNLLTVEDFPLERTQAWERLASERGIKMPGGEEKVTVKRLLSYLSKAGVTRRDCAVWLGDEGCSFPGDYMKNNPRFPLYALVGTILENVEPGDAKLYPDAFAPNKPNDLQAIYDAAIARGENVNWLPSAPPSKRATA